LAELNESFDHELFGPNNVALKHSHIYAGSTRYFMQRLISDKNFHLHKPYLGDMDIFVPHTAIAHLNCLLDCDMAEFEIMGKVRNGVNISLLLRRGRNGCFQLDFIPAKFNDQWKPSPWDRFCHSAPWIDAKLGIKGAIHKIALSSIAAIPDFFGFEVDAKGNKITYGALDKYSFSVVTGLRNKYKEMSPGHFYKFRKASDTYCIQDINELYRHMFMSEPTIKDLVRFASFVGVCSLVRTKMTDRDTQKFVFGFIERLYGTKARKLGATSQADAKLKDPAIGHLRKVFPEIFTDQMEYGLETTKNTFKTSEFKEDVNEDRVLSGTF
jgi:hypothetical protein